MARILIVDDNEVNLSLLETLLSGHGHNVVSALNGVEALEKAQAEPPDIIVTDILMPEMDGFALCRRWKADDVLKSKPFVIYTATYTDPQDEEFALSLGADRFVLKPTEPAELVQQLEETLGQHQIGAEQVQEDTVETESIYLRKYNDVLVHKLEDKVNELKSANRQLEEQLAALNAAHQELRVKDRAMESTSAGILVSDAYNDHEIIYCNSAFESVTGYTRAEVIGKNCRFLQGSDRVQRGLEEVRAALREKRSCQVIVRNYRKDGEMFWNRLTISPVPDESGAVTHFVGVQEDITLQRRAEKAEEEARKFAEDLIATAHAIVVTLDTDGTIKMFNQAAEDTTGYEFAELRGRNWFEVVVPKDRYPDVWQEFQRLISGGKASRFENPVLTKDGRERHIVWQNKQLFKDGELQGTVSFGIDMTDHKRVQEDAKQAAIAAARIEMLSPREQEVFHHVIAGRPNKSVARRMDITIKTVEKHRASLMKKLDARTVVDLVRLATLAERAEE